LAEVVCDTSPLQYLHQLQLLHLLPSLARNIVIPPAVEEEILAGKAQGIDLPDLQTLEWLSVRHPVSRPAVPLVRDLGPGETEVLMLGLEIPSSLLILDDALARRVAENLQIPFTGTLGLLLDAKRSNHISSVAPLLDQLQDLRFRLSTGARAVILRLAGEQE
jgi:uncharacterized protein